MRASTAGSVLVWLALAACRGEPLTLDPPPAPAVDGGGSGAPDAGARDAAPEPPADGGGQPGAFGPPRVIAELVAGDSSDDDPSLSEDRLLLCFNSKRDAGEGAEDIWCTTRAATTAPWAAPEPLADLNTERRETGVALALDGLTLWFSSDREGGAGGLDVYVVARRAREAPWSAPARVPELSGEGDDLVSAVDASGRRLLLARRDDDDDDYDVWLAERSAPSEAWEPPRPLADVNTGDEESDAFWVGTGLALIFTRDDDLILARRATIAAPFDRGEPIAELNSDGDDRDAWANASLTYIVFSSDRDGSHKLYDAVASGD